MTSVNTEFQKRAVSSTKFSGPKVYSVRFPPFPAIPHGISIVPFKDFVPCGYRRIRTQTGEEIEVDAFGGLPTVKVLSEEEAAQKVKDRRKRRNAGQSTDTTGRIVPWWEEWEEGESLRTTQEPVDLQKSLIDRVHEAADDFRLGRTWPPISSGVRTMWDHFRLYIGLLSSLPIYRRVKRSGGGVHMFYGDDDASDENNAPKAKHVNIDIIQDPLEQIAHPGKQLVPGEAEAELKGRLLECFIEDTEKSIKAFMSSYMRDKGLIWSDRNLFIAPALLHFFLRFMLRNGVFAGSGAHIDNLNRALLIAELAMKELPLTAKVARILPSSFDIACKECWESKGSLSMYISGTTASTSSAVSTFEEALKADHVEVVSSDVVLDSLTAKEVLDDASGTDNGANVSFPPVDDPWVTAITAGQITSPWAGIKVDTLLTFLGPTRLPLTHTTGVVEFSTRKVKYIIPPEVVKSTPYSPSVAVEQELGSRFARIVMEPWVRTPTDELVDIVKPTIRSFSRGAIVDDPFAEGSDILDIYNPYHDDLSVLVEPASMDYFRVGLGLCGTWVQIARCEDIDSHSATTNLDAPQVSKHPRDCFWYLEDVVSVFPSFYMESELTNELVQISDDDVDDL